LYICIIILWFYINCLIVYLINLASIIYFAAKIDKCRDLKIFLFLMIKKIK